MSARLPAGRRFIPVGEGGSGRSVLCAEIRAEIAVKIYRVLEKQWAQGCCHIGFPKRCSDGKHASVVMLVGGGGGGGGKVKI